MAAMVNGVPVALPPPPGYVVDFDNPARNSVTEAYWLFGVGNFMCLLFMLQRAYVKIFIHKRIQIEDGCLFVAWVFSSVLQSLILRDFIRGIMGTHAWEMPFPKFMQFVRALYLLPILYNPVQAGAKMALLLLYRRLAPQRWFQYMNWSVIAVVLSSSTALLFITIFPCRPVSGAWDLTLAAETVCVDRPAIYKATAVIGAVTDLMVLAVPLPIVIKLQIPLRQKIGLIILFSLGIVTVFTSIARLIALIKSMGTTDQSWGGGPVLLWIFAEANMSVICGSISTIKVFITNISPRILGSSAGSKRYGGPSNPSIPISHPGSRHTRPDKYSRFDDNLNFELETVVDIESGGSGGRQHRSQDDGWDHTADGGSEKAIIQTRTTTVTYD